MEDRQSNAREERVVGRVVVRESGRALVRVGNRVVVRVVVRSGW